MTILTGTLYEDVCTSIIISRTIVFRVRKISDNICKKIKIQYYVQQCFSKNRAFYDIMWKNMDQPQGPHTTI